VRSLCNRLAEARHDDRQPIDRLLRQLVAWGCVREDPKTTPAARLALAALSDGDLYGSARNTAGEARRTASIVRERLSQDMWQLLGRLEARLQWAPESGVLRPEAPSEPEILDCADQALQTLAALSGLMDENFNRVAGWSFLDIGKRIERAINTCRFTRQFTDGRPTMESLDVLIELIDSQITYRSRYLSGAAQAPVLDMALLDPFNPRSVGFQVARMDDHLAALPTLADDGVMEKPRRMSNLLRAELASREAKTLDTAAILAIEQRLLRLAEAISERYFLHRDSALAITKRAQFA